MQRTRKVDAEAWMMNIRHAHIDSQTRVFIGIGLPNALRKKQEQALVSSESFSSSKSLYNTSIEVALAQIPESI